MTRASFKDTEVQVIVITAVRDIIKTKLGSILVKHVQMERSERFHEQSPSQYAKIVRRGPLLEM